MSIDSQSLDQVLRALADPTRRALYLMIAAQPGMTTHELAASIDGMSRWGVMKHLGVLRDAGLVQSLSEGRQRRHYHESAALDAVRQWLAEATGPEA